MMNKQLNQVLAFVEAHGNSSDKLAASEVRKSARTMQQPSSDAIDIARKWLNMTATEGGHINYDDVTVMAEALITYSNTSGLKGHACKAWMTEGGEVMRDNTREKSLPSVKERYCIPVYITTPQYLLDLESERDVWRAQAHEYQKAYKAERENKESSVSIPDIDPEILPVLIEAIRDKGKGEMHGETAHVEFHKNPELMDALFSVADWLSNYATPDK